MMRRSLVYVILVSAVVVCAVTFFYGHRIHVEGQGGPYIAPSSQPVADERVADVRGSEGEVVDNSKWRRLQEVGRLKEEVRAGQEEVRVGQEEEVILEAKEKLGQAEEEDDKFWEKKLGEAKEENRMMSLLLAPSPTSIPPPSMITIEDFGRGKENGSVHPWTANSISRLTETEKDKEDGGKEEDEPLNWTAYPTKNPPSQSSRPTPRLSSPSPQQVYMLTRTYGGQLTRAIKNMMMQQCWATRLLGGDRSLVGGAKSPVSGITILEPFSTESLLVHETRFWREVFLHKLVNAARFSDYFDLQYYNEVSQANGAAPLATLDQFLTQAPKDIVVVLTPKAACDSKRRGNVAISMDKGFVDFISGLNTLGYSVVKEIRLECTDSERSRRFVETLTPFLYNSTLVFGSWRSYHVVDSWLHVSKLCDTSDKEPAPRLRPSAKIQHHMDNYRSNVLRTNQTIAIMLRVERFLTLKTARRSNQTVESCLQGALELYNQIRQQQHWTNSQPYLTLDIGRFGSGIMQTSNSVLRFGESLEEVTQLVTSLLVKVYSGRWKSIEHWEDSFVEATEGIEERGYVAMLQRGIAVESDCLILMGGGSYQEVAARQYLEAHPDPSTQCLHTICSATAITTSLHPKVGKI